MTEADVKRFLALLQAGLWKMPVDAGLFRGAHVDWAGLFRLSKEQAVAGIVFDGIGAFRACGRRHHLYGDACSTMPLADDKA